MKYTLLAGLLAVPFVVALTATPSTPAMDSPNRFQYKVVIEEQPTCIDADTYFNAIRNLGAKIVSVTPGVGKYDIFVITQAQGMQRVMTLVKDGKEACILATSNGKNA